MSKIVSIETCSALTTHINTHLVIDTVVPTSAELAPVVDKIPVISEETQKIFLAVLHNESKIPNPPDLRATFSHFHEKVREYEALKAQPPSTVGKSVSFVTYIVAAAALHALGVSSWLPLYGAPILPSIAAGIVVDLKLDNSHKLVIHSALRSAAICKQEAHRATGRFATFFKNKQVVQILKSGIAQRLQK